MSVATKKAKPKGVVKVKPKSSAKAKPKRAARIKPKGKAKTKLKGATTVTTRAPGSAAANGRSAAVAKKAPPSPKTLEELLHFVENVKRQWMSTIDAMIDPLMIVTRDFKVQKANFALAKMAGLNVKDVLGKKCYEMFAARKSPCPGCKMKEAAKTSELGSYNLENVRGDRFYEVSSQPMTDLDGHKDGVVQIYRDRTEAKRLQQQLSQQEKLASIGLLAGGVAHEINNPLGGILIFSQMLLREIAKDSPHYQDVVEIEAATQRCKAIVESLLDFARQNPGPGKKNKADDVDVLDAIRTAMRFGKVGIKAGANVDVTDEFSGDHTVKVDRNRLIQLFLNLIQNALQAMPDGGTLVIRARRVKGKDGPIGRYEVEDTGVGIAPEHLGKIFDPFFTTKDPGDGTGLGLALCYGIVQELHGVMRVDSTINVGTRFTIDLPLGQAVSEKKPA